MDIRLARWDPSEASGRNLRQIKGKIVTPEGGRQQILNRCIFINIDDGTKILAPSCVAQKST